MPNLQSVLRQEIRRFARKEVRAELEATKKAVTGIRVSGPGESILINRSSKSPIERLELALGTVRTKSGQMVCKRFSDHSGR